MRGYKLKTLAATAALLTTTSLAHAEDVEVLHWWTSGGEAAALNVLKDDLSGQGIGWQDMPVAGGGGTEAMTVLRARVTSGNPPTAVQMLGFDILDWAEEGALANLNDVAAAEGWDDVVPEALQAFAKHDGNWISAPVNVHSTNWVWANKAILDELGIAQPTTWDEFVAALEAVEASGRIALAHGGQAWQDATVFDGVVLSTGGIDFYRQAFVDLDPEALGSDTMVEVFDRMATLRSHVDENFSGRDWNLASAMVINGEAAFQIMGDWAKGEFTNAGLMAGDDFACIPVPKTDAGGFVYLVNSLSFFAQPDPEQAEAQATLASAIMDPAVQVAFNQAKGAIPARTDVDLSAMDSCAQATAAEFVETDTAGSAVPTFAGTHASNASVSAAATDVITEFFNSDMTPQEAVELLAEAVELAQ